MKAFFALLRREFLEHRGAFFYAPLVLLGLFLVFTVMVLASHHIDFALDAAAGAHSRLYDLAYLGVGTLWWLYLAMMLFFYYADGFHADTRNNAMLFWKSMPVSDFLVLVSKFTAGLTVFPALVFGALLVSGVIVALAALALPLVIAGVPMPNPGALAGGWVKDSAVFLVYLVLVLLWYAPFFAWVGALSTLVGRWSIPLALLIPVGLSLFEGVIDFSVAPGGSYLLSFLRERINFHYDSDVLFNAFLSPRPSDASTVLSGLITAVDWPQLVAGLLFAGVVIYLASLHRRRVIKG